MRITVIIPSYNCARYLADAIRSVLAQTYPAHELLVIDDGSTDETPWVMREFENKVTYIRTENRGCAAARNAALDRATGDAVAFLDADDGWYPRKLELETRVLEAEPDVQAICTEFSLVDEQGALLLERHVKTKYRVFDAYRLDWPDMFPHRGVLTDGATALDYFYGDAFRALFLGNFVNTSSIVVRRTAIDRAGRFTAGRKTQTDYEFWLKIAMGGSMAFLDEPLLWFRRRPNQLTSADQFLRVAQDVTDVVDQVAGAARARLGDAVVADRMADRYRLLALAFLGGRQPSASRRALAQAFAYSGLDHRLALLYAWSWIPAPIADGLRRGYRSLRGE